MNDLEDVIMVAPDGSSYEADDSERPDRLASISRYVEQLSPSLRRVSLEIHDHPELRYKETHAHEVLTRFMALPAGWAVTRSAYGVETAFVAVFDSGRKGPVVSFNAEYGRTTSLMVCYVKI